MASQVGTPQLGHAQTHERTYGTYANRWKTRKHNAFGPMYWMGGDIKEIIIIKSVHLSTSTKDDDDWVKKCMEYEVEGSRPRGRPKRTWKQVVREDCQACKLNKEDAVDHCKWRKVIKEVR